MRDAALLREAWRLLGVDRMATAEQVRAAWKRKLKEVHPDVGGSKEAAQHATSMRDVLLAWIAAGRPDLEVVRPAAAYARARSEAQNFAWPQTSQSQPAYSWSACLGIVAIWGIALLLSVLSAAPRTTYRQPLLATAPYGLAPCTGMDVWEETKAILDGKCWPPRSR